MQFNLTDYIKPELLILVPVLYCVGLAFKKSAVVADKFIPLLLGACGVVLSVLYVLSTSDVTGWQAALSGVFVALTQGVLCAGASVYVNQVIKQGRKE